MYSFRYLVRQREAIHGERPWVNPYWNPFVCVHRNLHRHTDSELKCYPKSRSDGDADIVMWKQWCPALLGDQNLVSRFLEDCYFSMVNEILP